MIRFGGLATGQDTASIVEALLAVERQPIERLFVENEEETQIFNAWTELDTKFTALNSAAVNLNSIRTWDSKTVDSSNSESLSASADFSSAAGKYSVSNITLATSHRISSDSQALGAKTDLALDGDFSINGAQISVESGDTLEAIRDKINNSSGDMSERVFASIIGSTLVLENAETGDSTMTVTDGTNDLAKTLGLLQDDPGNPGTDIIKNELQVGGDFSADINGVPVTSTKNSGITDFVDGLTFNFLDNKDATIEVKRDTETVKAAFEDFVTAYNEAMEEVENYTRVEVSSNESTGDTRVGTAVLQGDSAASNIRFNGRSAITSAFGGSDGVFAGRTLEAIGIWTDGRENRLKIVSESQLEDALANNFDDVEDMIRDFENGIMRKFEDFSDSVQSPIDGTIFRKQESLRKSIAENDERIAELNQKLIRRETELFEQFARMEASIAGIQQQGNFLAGLAG